MSVLPDDLVGMGIYHYDPVVVVVVAYYVAIGRDGQAKRRRVKSVPASGPVPP